MHSPKKVYLLIGLVLFSTLIAQVLASPNPTAVFRGGGVTIDLTYPEEAHPAEISHNLTITTNTDVEVQNITLFIYAPVNSTWEYINKSTIILPPLPANQSLPFVIWFTLPQNANGTLYCLLYVQTDQAASYLSYIFYTTHISELTFSEMQSLYNEMYTNYTLLQADYETKVNDYNVLLADFNSSLDNYTSLLNQHTELQTKYNSQVAAYNSLLSSNNQLSQEYNNLNANYKAKLTELSASQSDYETLNTTKNNLQTSYTSLQNVYNALNQTKSELLEQINSLQKEVSEATISRILLFIALIAVAGLVTLIVYLKRKKPEPYMVIRKETVTVPPQDEDNPPT
jgi:hypothetical protein